MIGPRGSQSVVVQRGGLRGRRIPLPPAVHGHRHFTSSLMKEAFFQLVEGRLGQPFFDLCAGSGQMAVEALSRGFSPVHCVERDEARFQFLMKELRGLDLVFHKKDFRRMAPICAAAGGVAFLDAPYSFWGSDGQCSHVEEFLLRVQGELAAAPGRELLLGIQSPVAMTLADDGLRAWIGEVVESGRREYRGHFLQLLLLAGPASDPAA